MTGIIILAAGASTRMGQPKQQLVYEQETLLQRAIRTAEAAIAVSVVVVLGANAQKLNISAESDRLSICCNDDWQEGMASSIRAGLHRLLKLHPAIEHVLLMLCDQPFVSTELLNQLIQTEQSQQAGIIACTYQNTLGAPVLFKRKYFNQLLALTGQEGAKKLLVKFSDDVIAVPFEQGAVDIDTPEDYEQLSSPE
ncbi:hypothetical protein GCM10027037_00190 [Mucilaginibacter koreensis]